jgi:formylglycine-generating enzyme required for sulfatase activity
MEKNKPHPLAEKDLDKLLNRAFLELDFNQAKNQALLESLGERALLKPAFSFSFKKIILNRLFISVALLTIAFSLYLWLKPSEPPQNKQEAEVPAKSKQHSIAQKKEILTGETAAPGTEIKQVHKSQPYAGNTKKETVEAISTTRQEIQSSAQISGYVKSYKTKKPLAGALVYKLNSSVSISASDQGYFALNLPKGEHTLGVSMTGYQTFTISVTLQEDLAKNIELTEVWKQLDEVTVKPREFIFPNLTESEKKSNEKQKKLMARQAARIKRDRNEQKYPFIPAPADQSLSEFYMEGTEVTNLEYRTFLFDLVIHDRKEEFLRAKPEQDLWVNAAGLATFDTLSKVYFSTRKFNSHPVVNIPVAGAEMYCAWLGEIANEQRRKDGKAEIIVRLPYEKEWMYAAAAGRPNVVYPWYTDSVQNHYHWFLANCCIQKQTDKFKYPFNKSDKYPLGRPDKFDARAYTSASMALGNNKVATVETYAYNPNGFNLYCMSGNVSEMVYANEGKKMKAKGGNWNSDCEHLKFNNDNEFDDKVKPSPMIGFRVCVEVKK